LCHPQTDTVYGSFEVDLPKLRSNYHFSIGSLITDVGGPLKDGKSKIGKVSAKLAVNPRSHKGKLEIFIQKANRLPNTDLIGKSDPYAVVYVGDDEVCRTRVIDDNLNPVWDHHDVNFVRCDRDCPVISVALFDEDLGYHDDFLGFCEFPITLLEEKHEVSGSFQLTREKNKPSGTVDLALKYTPNVELHGIVKLEFLSLEHLEFNCDCDPNWNCKIVVELSELFPTESVPIRVSGRSVEKVTMDQKLEIQIAEGFTSLQCVIFIGDNIVATLQLRLDVLSLTSYDPEGIVVKLRNFSANGILTQGSLRLRGSFENAQLW